MTACGSGGTTPEKLPEGKEKLEAGTYTGVFIVKEIPMIQYIEKALDDPSSLPELDGDEAEACEGIDLNDEQVRAQIEEFLEQGKSTIGKEVPMTVVITSGDGADVFNSTIKIDFKAAFPEYECEEAEDESYTVTHSEGKVTFTNATDPDEDGIVVTTLFEGAILKGGVLQGNFSIKNPSNEYVEYTGSDIMLIGTWEVKK